ncbi:MAG TPA: CHAT domain-containing tetratricopeptide repeat protein [Chryseolinea sp.]|nr:CHAT domain-containing tetratricopeptide repeat protein [Chryseolinea sp.]
MIRTFAVLLVLCACTASGQVIKKIKSITSKENRQKVAGDWKQDLDRTRDKFDSTDFDYAILLLDNSGLFDVKEKGELLSKLATGGSLVLGSIDSSKSNELEKARFQLETGELAYATRKFTFAEKRFSSAIVVYERAGLTDNIGYMKALADQGLLFGTMGRFTQAMGYTTRALELRKVKFGETNIGVASSLNNLAVLQFDLAQYNESEKTFDAALLNIEKNVGKSVMQYAIVQNNRAMLYQTIGRYEEADEILKKAIEIAENLGDEKSKNGLKFLSNQALLYQQMGRYDDAEAIYQSMERRLGKTNPDYASMLNSQAALYMAMGKEDKVEELLKKSQAIFKTSFGGDSPAFAKSTSDLGNFYRYKERYAEAQPLLDKALLVREKAFGTDHPLFVQSQEDVAILYWKKKEYDKAYSAYKSVMDKSVTFISRYFASMSEAEKTKYWDVLSPRFQRFYNFAIEASSAQPSVLRDMFEYQMATKALLLSATNRIKRSILTSGNKELVNEYNIWIDQKETLARYYQYSKEELKEQKINLDSMVTAANTMEKRLSELSKEFVSGYGSLPVSYQEVKSALGNNEVVVELIRVTQFDQKFTAESRYAALIISSTTDLPKLVLLDNGAQLDTRYAKFYRNAIQQRIADEHSYEQYWRRIADALGDKKVVYVSPDGVYNQINLNTLKQPGGTYTINTYDFITLGNSKDLLAFKSKKKATASKKATLIGFPDYGSKEVSPLPATKAEIEGINRTLKAAGYASTSFMQKTASEANLKGANSPTVMHIATHGYFLKDVEVTGSGFGVHMENATENPLLRSGLILTGGGKTVSGEQEPSLRSNDNGVLTAYEAMNLNLQGTSLVVLSACETGLGEVKAGEGVYGLQRAFQVAGAEALVMSLWKVDDAATQQLMTNFYTSWIKLGNKHAAFKQAQLQLMTKYKDPYYWGAFVMMGM